jgi:hypothetical protein
MLTYDVQTYNVIYYSGKILERTKIMRTCMIVYCRILPYNAKVPTLNTLTIKKTHKTMTGHACMFQVGT